MKKTYVSGILGRSMVMGLFIPYYVLRGLVEDLVGLKNPLDRYYNYKSNRGMSLWHDSVNWLGGYPYECANQRTSLPSTVNMDSSASRKSATNMCSQKGVRTSPGRTEPGPGRS